jgi:D-3-phosphoglycerate dehydrogenase
MNNVVLAPHLGASTEEAQERVGEMAVHQIKQFFLHKQLLHEVK